MTGTDDATPLARARDLHRQGRLDEAVALYAQAPADDGTLFLLAMALLGLGRDAEALARFDAALGLKADWPEALAHRGVALRRLGRPAEAEAAQAAAIALRPDYAAAHANRGAALMDLGRPAEALASFEAAAALQPDSALPQNGRGQALLALDRPAEALAALDAALALDPGYATAHYNRGCALIALDRPGEALAALDRALAGDPGNAEAHNNRGAALVELERFDEAVSAFVTAADLGAGDATLEANLGLALLRAGRPHDALARAEAALARNPDDADARFSRSLALLTLGRFADGWTDYERRWDAATFLRTSAGEAPAALRARLSRDVTARDLDGRRLLLVGEQGVGDVIMFASILPDVLAAADQVTLACDPRLHRLFARSFPGLRLVAPGGAASQAAEIVLGIGSLGGLFRTRAEDFPGAAYLAPDPAARARWAKRLGPRGAPLRVGISWRGGMRGTGRTARSTPLAALAEALTGAGCELVSLQYGDAAREAEGAVRTFPAAETDDFEDLAALALELDAVVSVQTALVHLCGAVGARCLAMVPHAPEWRYAAGGSSMPWYGSVRLFRQGPARDWGPVLAAVAKALSA